MARRRAEEEHENHERWLVSYADFITLLFAFFTVLYATSSKDFEKEKQFQESIKKAFMAFMRFGGTLDPGNFPVTGEDVSFIPPPFEVFKRSSSSPSELKDALERALSEVLSDEERKALGVDVRQDPLGVRLALDSSVVFASGSSAMKRDVLKNINKIAEVLKKTEKGLLIEGHTDNQPIATAQYPSNWELAAARASTFVRYLARVHKIEESRLAAISYSDQRPIADNNTDQGRSKNRRIEVLITGDSKK